MKKIYLKCILCFALLAFGACNQDENVDAPAAEKAEDPGLGKEGIRGTKLASIDLENSGTLDFWEVAPGQVGIHFVQVLNKEDLKGSNKKLQQFQESLDLLVKQNKSIVEIYEAITSTPRHNEIKVLNEAHRRYLLHQEQIRTREKNTNNPFPFVKSTSSETPLSNSNLRIAGCTPDYYNDGYGASWFLQNFCQEGVEKFCRTNIGWAEATGIGSHWFKTYAMAADFEAPVKLVGGHYEEICSFLWWDCSWIGVKDFELYIQPRTVQGWYYTGFGYRHSRVDGLDPCHRAHFSTMWNP